MTRVSADSYQKVDGCMDPRYCGRRLQALGASDRPNEGLPYRYFVQKYL